MAFDASASRDADGSINSYAWDFGDGATGSGRTAMHTFANSGACGAAPLTVTFDASESSDEDGDPVAFAWDVAGLAVSAGTTVGHTFPEPGIYAVRLTVTRARRRWTAASTGSLS